MVYNKNELDEAFKDKRFDEGIRVELIFDNAEDQYPDGRWLGTCRETGWVELSMNLRCLRGKLVTQMIGACKSG